MKFALCISLHMGIVGETGGCSLPRFLREKKKFIWVPFLEPEDVKSLSLGPSGTLVKEQGCPELILDYGSQRARL